MLEPNRISPYKADMSQNTAAVAPANPQDSVGTSVASKEDSQLQVKVEDPNVAQVVATEEPEKGDYVNVSFLDIAKEFSLLGYIGFGESQSDYN